MTRKFSIGSFVAAILLAGWGGYLALRAPTPAEFDPPLIVEWPSSELGEVSTGHHELIVQVTNSHTAPRRILGMHSGCRGNVCFKPKTTEPVVIPPGQTVAFVCHYEVTEAGPLLFPIILFLEEHGIREAEWTVSGVAVPPRGD